MAYGLSYTNRDSTRTAPSSSPAADHWGMRVWPAPSGFVLAASRDALRRHRPDYAVTGRHLGVRRSPALTAPVGEGLAGSRHGCQPARAAHPECHAERGPVGPESKHPLSSPERRRDRDVARPSGIFRFVGHLAQDDSTRVRTAQRPATGGRAGSSFLTGHGGGPSREWVPPAARPGRPTDHTDDSFWVDLSQSVSSVGGLGRVGGPATSDEEC